MPVQITNRDGEKRVLAAFTLPANPETSKRTRLSITGEASDFMVVAEPKLVFGLSFSTRASAEVRNTVPSAGGPGSEELLPQPPEPESWNVLPATGTNSQS